MKVRPDRILELSKEALRLQREYYSRTAAQYEQMRAQDDDEHDFALSLLSGLIGHFSIASVLDIGSGTGRAILHIRRTCPNVALLGIEPSEALRRQAQKKGLSPKDILDGDAQALHFPDGAFDAVCAFGTLHHVLRPDVAVREMLRVAKKAIFISDENNFGSGPPAVRLAKQVINAAKLWRIYRYLVTGGRMFRETDDDGISFSYSVYNDLPLIRQQCSRVHTFNTRDARANLYRTASHVAVLGIKGH